MEKFTFRVKADKYFGSYLTEMGIKVILNKCDEIINLETPSIKGEDNETKWDVYYHKKFISRFSSTRFRSTCS